MSGYDEKDMMTAENENISSASPLSEEGYSPITEEAPSMGPEPFNSTEVISGVQVVKRSPGKLIAVIAAVVIAVFALCGGAYALIPQVRNAARSLLTSDASYYHWIEERNLSDGTDRITEAMDKSKEMTDLTAAFELKPDNEGISKLLESKGQNISGLKLPDMGYDLRSTKTDDVQNLNASFSANGTPILSANSYVKDGSIYYQIPELSSDYICLDLNDIIEKGVESQKLKGISESDAEKLKTIKKYFSKLSEGDIISSDDLNTLIKKYGNIIFDNVGNVDKETGVEVEADGISSKYTRLTASIDAGTLFHIAKEGLDELEDDKLIKRIIVEDLELVSSEDYDKAFDKLDDKIDSYDEVSGGEVYFTMDVYVNSRGEIVGRTINADKENIKAGYLITNDGDDWGFTIFADMKGERYSLDGNAHKDGNKFTGKASANAGEKKDIISISFEDLECVDEKYVNGSITLGLSSLGFDDITVSLENKDDMQHISSDITYGGNKLFTLSADYGRKTPDKITVFNNDCRVYKLTEIKDYLNSIDKTKAENFIKNIFKAMGMTDEQIAQLEGNKDLGELFSDEVGKLSQNGGDVLLTGGSLLSDAPSLSASGNGEDQTVNSEASAADDALGDTQNADSGTVEVKYDLTKVSYQFDGKDIKLPSRIDGIDKMVKFEKDKLDARYGYAYGSSEDYSLSVSVSNKTDKEISVNEGNVEYISVSDTASHTLTVDGIGCGDDIKKAADKYGITLRDPQSGYVVIKNTEGYNYISMMYSQGKIWNLSVRID